MPKRSDRRTDKQAKSETQERSRKQEELVSKFGKAHIQEMQQKYCMICLHRNNSGACSKGLLPIDIEDKVCMYHQVS